jgi:hypothetical protein
VFTQGAVVLLQGGLEVAGQLEFVPPFCGGLLLPFDLLFRPQIEFVCQMLIAFDRYGPGRGLISLLSGGKYIFARSYLISIRTDAQRLVVEIGGGPVRA